MTKVLGGILAGESWTLSQSYYYGSVNKNPSHQVQLIEGASIDLRADLDATAIGDTRKKTADASTRPASDRAYAPVSDKRYEAFLLSVLDTLRREATKGQKHSALLRCATALGGIQAAAGFSDETAVQWLLDALPDTVEDWNRAGRTAKDGLAYGRAKPIELEDRPYTGNGTRPAEPPPPEFDDSAPPGHPAAEPATKKRKKKPATGPLPEGWQQYLQRKDGEPVCNLANALTAFRSAPELEGIVAYDLMMRQTLVTRRIEGSRMKGVPDNRPLQDTDVSEFQEWIQRHGEMRRMSRETVQQAVDMVAREHAFHPVQHYLNSVRWDGKNLTTPASRGWISGCRTVWAQRTRPIRAKSAACS